MLKSLALRPYIVVTLSIATALLCCAAHAFGNKTAMVGPSSKAAPAPPPSMTVSPEADEVLPSDKEVPVMTGDEADKPVAKAPLVVNLNIPHQSPNTTTVCTAFPYPMPPPKPKRLAPMGTRTRSLKGMIQQSGYVGRHVHREAFPLGGWRWQYAYHNALKRSGRGEPHGLFTMYSFVNDVLPYVREEVERSNEFEEERLNKLIQATEDYNKMRADADTEALRKGLVSSEIRINRLSTKYMRQGGVKLKPGQYWIVCTHKIPGLTYYWQVPVTVHEGEPTELTLGEDNALSIEGAW